MSAEIWLLAGFSFFISILAFYQADKARANERKARTKIQELKKRVNVIENILSGIEEGG